MKVTTILNGISIQKDIPTNWDEVTFKDFLNLEACGQDIVKIIALFTDQDYDTLRRSKIVDMDQVIAVLGFLRSAAVTVIPKTILGYPMPSKLEFEQVQMYIDLKNYVDEGVSLPPSEQLARYTLYCAVYACQAKHGRYDWQLAEAMKDEFLNAPCTEVMGIGNFTLMKLAGLKHNIDLTYQKVSSPLKRLRLVLAGWRIRMVLYLRSFNWRKRLV